MYCCYWDSGVDDEWHFPELNKVLSWFGQSMEPVQVLLASSLYIVEWARVQISSSDAFDDHLKWS